MGKTIVLLSSLFILSTGVVLANKSHIDKANIIVDELEELKNQIGNVLIDKGIEVFQERTDSMLKPMTIKTVIGTAIESRAGSAFDTEFQDRLGLSPITEKRGEESPGSAGAQDSVSTNNRRAYNLIVIDEDYLNVISKENEKQKNQCSRDYVKALSKMLESKIAISKMEAKEFLENIARFRSKLEEATLLSNKFVSDDQVRITSQLSDLLRTRYEKWFTQTKVSLYLLNAENLLLNRERYSKTYLRLDNNQDKDRFVMKKTYYKNDKRIFWQEKDLVTVLKDDQWLWEDAKEELPQILDWMADLDIIDSTREYEIEEDEEWKIYELDKYNSDYFKRDEKLSFFIDDEFFIIPKLENRKVNTVPFSTAVSSNSGHPKLHRGWIKITDTVDSIAQCRNSDDVADFLVATTHGVQFSLESAGFNVRNILKNKVSAPKRYLNGIEVK